ncbi:MAG: 3-methyl-2-oxobutanoate hydroxymethyltransferase [Gammaproteobacteria bacterium]|nr:3-methyl-2-oxobutanoate hydroxymethyltransferase [Gammaproteobacteria bacterium]
MNKASIQTLMAMKQRGEKIAMLTCYDAGFTPLLEQAGVDVLLVGDSLGMVIQGHETTLPVTLDQIVYHSSCVDRARRQAFLIADLPFLSYFDAPTALRSAARLMQEGGAQMVKLEGGQGQLERVATLAGQGVPVCGHLGLQPQLVHQLGGYRTQGKEPQAAERMRRDARLLEDAGAQMLVLECVPTTLAAEISQSLSIPVIGIGAGPDCDGQVLVLYDALGITRQPPPFAQDFMQGADSIEAALSAYVSAVRQGQFPARPLSSQQAPA